MKQAHLLYVIIILIFLFLGCKKKLTKPSESTKETITLNQAVTDGDIKQVKLLISNGMDLNAKDEKEITPLCHAIKSGKIELVRLLVEAGADVNAGKWPPLCVTVDENNIAMAKYLIAHGANVNAGDEWTALQQAPYISDNIKMVALLLANGANVNAGPFTALHAAVQKDRLDIIKLLITKGADVNPKDKSGITPLQNAVSKGKFEVVRLLIEAGADVNTKDNEGETPLHFILDVDRMNYRLFEDVAELLISKGADVNLKDSDGRTALHLAAESADENIVELLLAKGTRINEKDDVYGFTALHYAARFGNRDVTEYLISKGADINATDKQDRTPLYIAVQHDYKVAELLINKGADSSIKAESGQTLLQLAQERKQIESTVPDMIFDTEPNSRFGYPIACGDIDGDGYDDIAIGAGAYNNKRGRVYLFYGGPDMDTEYDLIFEGENEGDLLGGGGISCDDIDNDGYDDIVIVACGYKENQGRAYLYWGGERSSMDTIPDKIFEGESKKGSWFGLGCSGPVIYDIDNDGYRDIIFGAYHYPDNGSGRAYLYYGNTKQLMDASYDLIFTGEKPKDEFGFTIGCGDVDNDGYGDVIIGARFYHNRKLDQGRAYLYYGDKRSNMNSTADVIFDAESEGRYYFGQGIVCDDFNNDGYDDLVIGAHGYKAGSAQGRAYLYYGGPRK